MSNYSQIVLYGPKDALSHGDPNKLIKGAQIDAELSAISTAISTKIDSTTSNPSVTSVNVTTGTIPTNGLYLSNPNVLGFAANGVYRGSIGAGGLAVASTTQASGITGIAQPAITGNGPIASSQGTATVTLGSFSTVFSVPNVASTTAFYLIAITAAASGDAQHYVALGGLFTNGATTQVTQLMGDPAFFQFTITGLNVQIKMTTGGSGPYPVQWSYLRIM